MGALINSLVMTADLFWHMLTFEAEEVYDYIAPRAAVYMQALVYTTLAVLITVPMLLLFKMMTGWQWCMYLAAVITIMAALVLGAGWSPLVVIISMVRRRSINPVARAERYVRFVGVALFTELMLTVYIALVPFHQNVGNIPMLLLLGAAFALGSMIWGGWLSGKFFTRVTLLMILVLTASFFLPRTFHKMGQAAAAIDDNFANPPVPFDKINYPICPGQTLVTHNLDSTHTLITVPLRMGCWSGTVQLPPDFRNWNWRFSSPGDLEFLFYNGERRFLPGNTPDYGWRPPSLEFRLRGEGYVTIWIKRKRR